MRSIGAQTGDQVQGWVLGDKSDVVAAMAPSSWQVDWKCMMFGLCLSCDMQRMLDLRGGS